MKSSSALRSRGRPRSTAAESHAAILEAVYDLLRKKSVRDLTMDGIAAHSGVSKPTLYKWWPTKAELVLALFHERIAGHAEPVGTASAEEAILAMMVRLVRAFRGVFGKVMADLIAEGQSEPAVLKDLYHRHIVLRRAAVAAEVERGKRNGEFLPNTDAEVMIDALFGAIYYRLMLKSGPLTEKYAAELLDHVLRDHRIPRSVTGTSSRAGRQ